MVAPLVLTGGPAVGKSSTAGLLARSRPRAAVVDVDDVRQLIVSGGVAPWQGPEGRLQQRLGVENTCDLTQRFLAHGIEVAIADVLTPETARLYRRLLPDAVVVHLQVSLAEAWRRAATRAIYLTEEEFEALHVADQTDPPAADHRLDVSGLTLDEQVDAVAQLWSALS